MKKTHLKWIYRSLFIAISLSIVVVFQNCAPANFVQTSQDLSSTSGTGDDPYGNDPHGSEYPFGNDPTGVWIAKDPFELPVSGSSNPGAIKILFIVDNSGTMQASVDQLRNSVSLFVAKLKEKVKGKQDVVVGITTTNSLPSASNTKSRCYVDNVAINCDYDTKKYVNKTVYEYRDYVAPKIIRQFHFNKTLTDASFDKLAGDLSSFVRLRESNYTQDQMLNFCTRDPRNSSCAIKLDQTSRQCESIIDDKGNVISENCTGSENQYERGMCVASFYLHRDNTFIKANEKVAVLFLSDENDASTMKENNKDVCLSTLQNKVTYKEVINVTPAIPDDAYATYKFRINLKPILPGGAALWLFPFSYTYKENKETCTDPVPAKPAYCKTVTEVIDGVQQPPKENCYPEVPAKPAVCTTQLTPVTKSENIQIPITSSGHKANDLCNETMKQQKIAEIKSQILALHPGATFSFGACQIAVPGGDGTFYSGQNSNFLDLGVSATITVSNISKYAVNDILKSYFNNSSRGYYDKLCNSSLMPADNGPTYRNIMDYWIQNNKAISSFYTVDAVSCQVGTTIIPGKEEVTTTAVVQTSNERQEISVLPANSSFPAYIAKMAQDRFSNAVYVTSITHLRGEANCSLSQGQSYGDFFVDLTKSNALGSHATTASICASNFDDPLSTLAAMTTVTQSVFVLANPLAVTERIKSVTVIKKTTNEQIPIATKDFGYNYNTHTLSVHSNLLTPGDRISVVIEEKK